MSAYLTYNPIVLVVYFVSVIGVTMFTMNPIILALSALSALFYAAVISDRNAFLPELGFYAALFALLVLINPLFNRNGDTVIFVLGKLEITKEAFLYGIASSTMIFAIIYWFKCYNIVVTSDKFMYVFGSIMPKLSLILSMALRFVPTFKKQIIKIAHTQKTFGLYTSGKPYDKAKNGIRIFTIMLTWSLENAVDTADSMNARGYGLENRTHFSLFKFTLRDFAVLMFIMGAAGVVLAAAAVGKLDFEYYPVIKSGAVSAWTIVSYALTGSLTLLPFITEIAESIKWKISVSKI